MKAKNLTVVLGMVMLMQLNHLAKDFLMINEMDTFRLAISFKILPPEISHSIALNSLKLLHKLKLINLFFPFKFSKSFEFKGLIFKNKLGIAAGLIKMVIL